MSNNRKYGFCRGCKKWIPRDDMLSINVSVYDRENMEIRIPLRFCPECHEKKKDELDEIKWDNDLKAEVEIRASKILAEQSDLEFDGSDGVQSAAENARERIADDVIDSVSRFKEKKKDDSEAAMRRRGKNLDTTY